MVGAYAASHSVAYEETQSKRVSDFRDFVCILFPKTILFDFYFPPHAVSDVWLTINVCGQDHRGPVYGFLVFYLEVVI